MYCFPSTVAEAGSQPTRGIHCFINKSFRVKMPRDWRRFRKTRIALGHTQQRPQYRRKPSTSPFAKRSRGETHPGPQRGQPSRGREHRTRTGTLAAEPSACFSLRPPRAAPTAGAEGARTTRGWRQAPKYSPQMRGCLPMPFTAGQRQRENREVSWRERMRRFSLDFFFFFFLFYSANYVIY